MCGRVHAGRPQGYPLLRLHILQGHPQGRPIANLSAGLNFREKYYSLKRFLFLSFISFFTCVYQDFYQISNIFLSPSYIFHQRKHDEVMISQPLCYAWQKVSKEVLIHVYLRANPSSVTLIESSCAALVLNCQFKFSMFKYSQTAKNFPDADERFSHF